MRIILIILLISLSGCLGIYNLGNFVLPDDIEFIECINGLDTLDKIMGYMKDNFIPTPHKPAYSPYEMWKYKKGDCNDYSNFAVFVAHYHGWEVYQILVNFGNYAHMMGIYKVDKGYLVSDWDCLLDSIYKDFKEIVDTVSDIKYYKVYDISFNLIEYGGYKE